MIELSDIIDIIWADGDKPIKITTDDGECLEVGDDDLTDVLGSTVTAIVVYESCVEIEVGE